MARNGKKPGADSSRARTSQFEIVEKDTTKLSSQDEAYLKEREKIIYRGLHTFIEVGQALIEIRDYEAGRLYKHEYGTFDAYCRQRWEFGRSYAHRLINAATITAELLPRGDKTALPLPTSEKQIRALALLEAQADRREAWKEAASLAQNKTITAQMVNEIVKKKIEAGAKRRTPEKPTQRKAKGAAKTIGAEKLVAIQQALAEIEKVGKEIAAIKDAVTRIRKILKD